MSNVFLFTAAPPPLELLASVVVVVTSIGADAEAPQSPVNPDLPPFPEAAAAAEAGASSVDNDGLVEYIGVAALEREEEEEAASAGVVLRSQLFFNCFLASRYGLTDGDIGLEDLIKVVVDSEAEVTGEAVEDTSRLFVMIVTGRSDVSMMLVEAIEELRNLDVMEFVLVLPLLRLPVWGLFVVVVRSIFGEVGFGVMGILFVNPFIFGTLSLPLPIIINRALKSSY